MSANLTLVVVAAALVGVGVYLLLARSVVRALLGSMLMGNGVNVLFLVASGPAGDAPILGAGSSGRMADPVPQALVLTAIVITLAMTAFVMALAHRSWQLGRTDLVADDAESARLHGLADANTTASDADDDAQAIAAALHAGDDGEEP